MRSEATDPRTIHNGATLPWRRKLVFRLLRRKFLLGTRMQAESGVTHRKQRFAVLSSRYTKRRAFAGSCEINRDIALIESAISHSKQSDFQKINRNISAFLLRPTNCPLACGQMVNLVSACKHLAGKLRPYNRGFIHVEVVLDRGLLIREAPSSSEQTLAEIPEDARLVTAAREGDRTAFGQLYERHARLVHGILMAHAPFAEVDDLVHDVFLIALRKLDSLREPAAFAGWLLAIARNRAVDFHRRSRTTEELPEETSGHDPGEYEARAALEAIRSLPEAYRETLVLRLVEGMTGAEIAARTGLTHASVRVNLHRGMKQLREKLGRSETHE